MRDLCRALVLLVLTGPLLPAEEISGELRQWHDVVLTFRGPATSEEAEPNPFLHYRLNVTFEKGSKRLVVPGIHRNFNTQTPPRCALTGAPGGAIAGEVCQAESDRLDSELAMIRYIAWAIPSIGFIGTVRGIGDALTQAHRAVQGDISGVTASLGTAFNSTFIALLLSLGIMFVLHQLQLRQERLVLDTEGYVDEHLLQHLQA